MAVALERFYEGDDAKWRREVEVFRTCSEKTGKILRWSRTNEESIDELRDMALSKGGLFNASMRMMAWRELLGIRSRDLSVLKASCLTPDAQELDIIRNDVQRSAMFRSKGVACSIVKGQQDSQSLETKLTSILIATVSGGEAATDASRRIEDKPCYYQGLHDVAFVLLQNLNYDEVAATAAFQKIVQTHLKDATQKDFSNVMAVLDSFLLPLIHSLDIHLYEALIESEVPLSNAVLPWLITLFTHSVQDDAVASRLMDAFIAHSHPMLPFYVAVALLLHPNFREQLLECALDPAMMQIAIQSLPGQIKNDFAEAGDDEISSVTAQDIIESALQIMHQNPPESLLSFVGVGLKKRTRRRLIKKMRSISMLRVRDYHHRRDWLSFGSLSDMFLGKHHLVPSSVGLAVQSMGGFVSSAACGVYSAAAIGKNCRGWSIGRCRSKAIDFSKDCLMVLQTAVMFVLIPKLHVEKLYDVMEGLLGWLRPSSWNVFDDDTKETTSNLELAMLKLGDYKLAGGEELGINPPSPPGMVQADTIPSLVEMDASDSSNLVCDPTMEMSRSKWSQEYYDFVV